MAVRSCWRSNGLKERLVARRTRTCALVVDDTCSEAAGVELCCSSALGRTSGPLVDPVGSAPVGSKNASGHGVGTLDGGVLKCSLLGEKDTTGGGDDDNAPAGSREINARSIHNTLTRDLHHKEQKVLQYNIAVHINISLL